MGLPPKKREWCYLMPPKAYEIAPCSCGNSETQWSIDAGYLWCAKCQKDFVPEHNGIFDGPILVGAAEILGISFDRMIIATGKIERFDGEKYVMP